MSWKEVSYVHRPHSLSYKGGRWKVTKVHLYYTFEQELLTKYILGNQTARQEAVARGDDVQANFWKLLNYVNFGFDCRDNSQNKSLHLIYNENTEVELISKYSKYDTNNCFVDLDARTKNIEEYYSNLDNLEDVSSPTPKRWNKKKLKE